MREKTFTDFQICVVTLDTGLKHFKLINGLKTDVAVLLC